MQQAPQLTHMHERKLVPFLQYRATVHPVSSVVIQPKCHEQGNPYAFGMGFAERLREARKAVGVSGEALGGSCGVSKQLVSHWEHGRHNPDVKQLAAICEKLNVTADWLIFGRGTSAEAARIARDFDALVAKHSPGVAVLPEQQRPSGRGVSGGIGSLNLMRRSTDRKKAGG